MDKSRKLPVPKNESARLEKLYDYKILDTIPEKQYDSITKLASYICDVPVALISLIDRDRQWFKSKQGLDVPQTSREASFCQYAIMQDSIFEVENALQDPIFANNPLVLGAPNIRFYTGAPLKTDGGVIGTLCVIDQKPNKLSDRQKEALEILAFEVVSQLDLRLKNFELEQAFKKIANFSKLASHDLKAPLRGISRIVTFSLEDFGQVLEEDLRSNLELILKKSNQMDSLIRDLLEYSRYKTEGEVETTYIDSKGSIEKIIDLLSPDSHFQIVFSGDFPALKTNKVMFEQIMRNLISNAIKYHDKPQARIEIACTIDNGSVVFSVTDNGPGIPKKFHESIFEPFTKAHTRKDVESSGLGLALVKEAVEELNVSDLSTAYFIPASRCERNLWV